jgi:hypothetical protein
MRFAAALTIVCFGACREAVPVLVTVPTKGAEVRVVHPWWHTSHLGTAPLKLAPGARVGDTVQLEDGARTYQESIQFGEPMGERVIQMR